MAVNREMLEVLRSADVVSRNAVCKAFGNEIRDDCEQGTIRSRISTLFPNMVTTYTFHDTLCYK